MNSFCISSSGLGWRLLHMLIVGTARVLVAAAAAAEIARRHRQSAPADVDAHALHALLLVMGADRGASIAASTNGSGASTGPSTTLLGCLEAMLRCDPGNEVAITGAAALSAAPGGVSVNCIADGIA